MINFMSVEDAGDDEVRTSETSTTVIKVVGVGGAGGNAVEHMIREGVGGVDAIDKAMKLNRFPESQWGKLSIGHRDYRGSRKPFGNAFCIMALLMLSAYIPNALVIVPFSVPSFDSTAYTTSSSDGLVSPSKRYTSVISNSLRLRQIFFSMHLILSNSILKSCV